MKIVSRVSSIAVAAALVAVAAWRDGDAANLFGYILVLVPPLALIWFSDMFGDYIGPVRGGYVDTPTPGFLIAAAGWFFCWEVRSSHGGCNRVGCSRNRAPSRKTGYTPITPGSLSLV